MIPLEGAVSASIIAPNVMQLYSKYDLDFCTTAKKFVLIGYHKGLAPKCTKCLVWISVFNCRKGKHYLVLLCKKKLCQFNNNVSHVTRSVKVLVIKINSLFYVVYKWFSLNCINVCTALFIKYVLVHFL